MALSQAELEDGDESSKEYLRPDFDHSISMDFQGATLLQDTGFILMRELDQRHNVIAPMADPVDHQGRLQNFLQ